MADKSLLEQMLERLVNEDQAKAEELFHEYVVAKSREIYEELIESEISEEDEEDKKKAEDDLDEAYDEDDKKKSEDDLEEATDEEDKKKSEDDLEEEFEDIAYEGDDEMDLEPGDPTDKLAGELGSEEGEEGEEDQKDPEELFQDLDSIVDELQAKFDELKGGGMDDMGGEEGSMDMKDDLEPELATVREYVEKVPAAKMGDNGANAKSVVAGKNDMGGTTENIARGGEEPAKFAGAPGGQLSGSSLLKGAPKEDNAGNINVPGGNAGKTAFKKKEPGHGAEKKGEAEGKYSGTGAHSDSVTVNKQSLFRGRR